jgi:hypothetical protein
MPQGRRVDIAAPIWVNHIHEGECHRSRCAGQDAAMDRLHRITKDS